VAGNRGDAVASYVVRIYRRIANRDSGGDTLAGLVENVHNNEKRAFHNMNELWDILQSPGNNGNRNNNRPPSP
jgi:hypothetical protein